MPCALIWDARAPVAGRDATSSIKRLSLGRESPFENVCEPTTAGLRVIAPLWPAPTFLPDGRRTPITRASAWLNMQALASCTLVDYQVCKTHKSELMNS